MFSVREAEQAIRDGTVIVANHKWQVCLIPFWLVGDTEVPFHPKVFEKCVNIWLQIKSQKKIMESSACEDLKAFERRLTEVVCSYQPAAKKWRSKLVLEVNNDKQ